MTSPSSMKVHVLYQSPNGCEPYGCSIIRLLRPLSHPSISRFVKLSYSNKIPADYVDVLIIERVWEHSFSTPQLLNMLTALKLRGTKIIYEADDDLLHVNSRPGDAQWPSCLEKNMIRLLAREADGVVVSTSNLAKVFSQFNSNIYIFENALDESLFERVIKINRSVTRFGYVGTFTHLQDLAFISPAIKKALHRHQGNVEFEVVGIGDEKVIHDMFDGLPVTVRRVPKTSVSYEKFCSWMSRNIHWDFGIAPLIASVFSDSKSDIKFLDYSILGIPGIYSDVPAYASTVAHGLTGLICKNNEEDWTYSLEAMINSESLRGSLADAAFKYVHTNRTLKSKAVELLNILHLVAKNRPRRSDSYLSTC